MQLLRFTAAVMLVFLLNECNSPALPLTEHKALGSVVQDLHDTSKTDLDAIRLWPAYKNYLGKLPDSLTGFFCFRGNTKQQAVALTFDDGPMASTPQLMLLLKKYNAPAAFFCLAQQITVQNASWYKDTLFTLALHSYSHINYDKTGPEKMRSEIKSSITIAERMGFKPRYFRPPYGIINAEEVKALKDAHLRGVIWKFFRPAGSPLNG